MRNSDLGVVLDPELNFGMQTDYAVAKASFWQSVQND